MSRRLHKHFLTVIFVIVFATTARTQAGLCPPNLDFEMGDFTNWKCRIGTVQIHPITGLNDTIWDPTSTTAVFDRHTMISLASAGNDTYGGFPRNCPNGSGYSVKLGNETASLNGGIGREASGISYSFTVPATATVYSVFFYYAVVLQNPNPPHTQQAQPRFRASIRDLTTGVPFPCVTFDFIAASSLGGFLPSPRDPNVFYKDWTPVTLDLSGLAGRTIEIEFIATECTQNGHFAYAYIDVNSGCNGAIQGTTICQGEPDITLNAPFGFQNYQWFSDNTFTTVLATTQSLYLNPAPAVGSILPVIVDPYPGFGCKDTLYATISVSPKPVSDAGADAVSCKFLAAQIGSASTPAYQYEWTPAAQVTSPIISNPFAWNTSATPTEFIVKTTDILTGCFSYDTTIVTNVSVDTVIKLISGTVDFCDGSPGPTLSVNNTSTSIQWYDNTTPVTGANGATYQPLVTGSYWAQVVQNGCTDSTRKIDVAIHPQPVVSFTPFDDTICVNGSSVVFTNLSATPDNSAMTHNWKFSDGVTLQTFNATRTFTGAGNYDVELVSTTAFGCKDSVHSKVYAFPNGSPDFSWDSICANRPVLFRNKSNESGSASVNYNWDFNDGGTGSIVKEPPPVTYTIAGTVDVTLEMTSIGCEAEPKSITKQVTINPVTPGIRYRDITVPLGSSKFIHVRGDAGEIYLWKPQVQLSQYNARYTEFFATGNDVMYLIEITDKHTCVTTDTALMQVLKKTGYYLPTAFTPNGDGLNDIAKPYLVGMKSLKSFSVFNRWGDRIFFTTTYGEGWNGKYKGLDQDNGVYVWILEFIDGNNKPVTEKGTIAIIR